MTPMRAPTDMPKETNVTVVIPVYNEIKTIQAVMDCLLGLDFVKEIIVVDDFSTDGSEAILQGYAQEHAAVRYFRNDRNRGKTASLKRGFQEATGDIVIVQDADLEYDPAEIQYVVQPIALGKADVVYGSRFLVKRATRVLYYYHYLANKCLTFASNILTNLNMTDIETCYKAFSRDIIQNMVITSSHFGFEIEATAKIAKLPCRIYEVPISYYGRTYDEGKKITTKDGIFALIYIVYYNLFVSKEKSFTKGWSFGRRPA